MARLFISHSSRNNDKAIEVRDWLAKNGWDDVFLDLDPERGIVAGQRWKDALQKAAQRCEMVLALISAEWLASPWCKAEIDEPNPLKIDPRLTDALLEEVSGQDALPLLAFTLAHLYENYAADNALNLPG